jgi:OmpA-OmpF porin, OOP family
MKTCHRLGLSALALAAPFAAIAQTDYQTSTMPHFDDRWYILPFASYTWADTNRWSDDGGGGGLAIGKPLNRWFNLELRGTYTDLASREDLGGDFTIGDIGLDGLLFFSRGRFQPFLLAGIGAINDRFSCNAATINIGVCESGNNWSFMAEAGAGFMVPIGDYAAIRVDGRYRYDDNSGDLWDNQSYGDWIVTAGVYIPLGSRAKPPVTKTFELSADALFAFNKADLKPTGVATLNNFARDLTKVTYNDVRVDGHTDPIGSVEYNLALSDRRANSVRDHLVGQGVSADKITAQGFGKSRLKVTPEDCAGARTREALIECYQPNRRVDVTVEGMVEK